MIIDNKTCIGCKRCIPYCPVSAISMDDSIAVIEQEICVECGVCQRAGVCKPESIYMPDLQGTRILRAVFSNPKLIHHQTQVPGRGTEEMKTNDVTGRYRDGEVGIGIEIGRHGVGTTLREVQQVSMAIAPLNIDFEEKNPVASLLVDKKTGKLRDDVLDEQVLSAIVEFSTDLDQLPKVLDTVKNVSKEMGTVFSVEVISRCASDGSDPARKIIEDQGFKTYPNGKTNLGIGRLLAEEG